MPTTTPMSRRTVVGGLAALGTAGMLKPPPAHAQAWPAKTIKVIIPFGAGSATDIVPRIVLEKVGAQVGQSFIIENRAGAGSTTGTAAVAKADADGYTLLATSSAFSIVPALYQNLGYDPVKDFAPIIPLGGLPSVLITSPDKGHKTVQAFVAAAKAKPGSFNFASLGVGSGVHMAAERFRVSAGFEAAHVAFKSGAEALTEVVAGRIDYYMCPVATALPLIREGKLVALAVSTPKRVKVLPDVPTTLEAGFKDSDTSAWVGLLAPAATPKDILTRLERETAAALADAEMQKRLEPNGVEPMTMTSVKFAEQIAAEIETNRALARALSLKVN
jgi:tripartite-type tricarboxylate transporter receptor subunit TctC